MTYTLNLRAVLPLLAVVLLLGMPCAITLAQDGRGDNDREGGEDRRRGFEIPDDATSDNNKWLERVLERFPDSDTDEDGTLNAEEARAFMDKMREQWREGNGRRQRLKPTHDNLAYGPDDKQVIDLYLPQSDKPTPLVLYFHGGQFITGDESSTRVINIQDFLNAGIAVASIDYRDTNQAPFPAPFDDAARAAQFLRYYAEQINVNPGRVAALGDEAGGNLALYLALHDDLAISEKELEPDPAKAGDDEDVPKPLLFPKKPKEGQGAAGDDPFPDDPLNLVEPWDQPEIATMSTRLIAAVAMHPIASFDPRDWKKHKLPMNDHERLMGKYLDVRYLEPLNDPEIIKLVEQVSPLALISANDPPLLLVSQYPDLELAEDTVWTVMRHHPKQIKLIDSAMGLKGNKTIVRYKGMQNDPGIRAINFLGELLK